MVSFSLGKLPPELVLAVTEQLELDDLKNLSLTNSANRAATASSLFKDLKVDCPLPEDHVAQDVVRKFGSHVLNLHLHVTLLPNKESTATEVSDMEDEDEDADEDGEGSDDGVQDEGGGDDDQDAYHGTESPNSPLKEDDPENNDNNNDDDNDDDDKEDDDEEEEETDSEDEARRVGPKWYWTDPPASVWARQAAHVSTVKDLIRFTGLPRCTVLSLHTNGDNDFNVEADWDDNEIGDGMIYFCTDPEDWDEVKRKEEKYAWRAALREMYQDIASLSAVEDLRIFTFLPVKASCWQKDEWAKFLGKLRRLTLYTYGGNNGAGWLANTLDGFNKFFEQLSDTMLGHAEKLEYLKIVADSDGFLGSCSLRLSPGIMPRLRVLHLEAMAVTSILPRFLKLPAPSLEEVHIIKCVSEDEEVDEETDERPKPTWAMLWKMLRQNGEKVPRVTYVQDRAPPLTDEEEDHGIYRYNEGPYVPPGSDDEQTKDWRNKSKEETDFYIWPYAVVDTKYGDAMNASYGEIRQKLELGEDNKEYALLMQELRRSEGVSG